MIVINGFTIPINGLTSWWFQPLWIILVKMGSSSTSRGENKKYLKAPPSFWMGNWCYFTPLFQWSYFTPLFSKLLLRSRRTHPRNSSSCQLRRDLRVWIRLHGGMNGRISRTMTLDQWPLSQHGKVGIQVSLVSLWHKISDQRVKTEVLLSKSLDISHMGAFQEAAFMQPPLPFLSQVN